MSGALRRAPARFAAARSPLPVRRSHAPSGSGAGVLRSLHVRNGVERGRRLPPARPRPHLDGV